VKFLFISDTHGKLGIIDDLAARTEADAVIHAGDFSNFLPLWERHSRRMAGKARSVGNLPEGGRNVGGQRESGCLSKIFLTDPHFSRKILAVYCMKEAMKA